MSLLAIDLGTSRCKAAVFDAAGRLIAQSAQTYAPDFPQPSLAEMHPEKFWHAVCRSAQTVARGLGNDPVEALCLSSHGETFIPVNARGEATAPAILNIDNRATTEAAWCEQALGRKQLFETTGLVVHPMYPIPKILWLRQHRPDVFQSTARFLSVTDYILSRLGLPPYIDYSLASRFLAFDVRQRRWSEAILNAAELKIGHLPIPVPAGTIAGKLGANAARELSVTAGTPAVVGGHDQACGALGVGVIEAGRVSDSMGTYECIVAASDTPSLDEAALAACLNSYCHVVPEKYVTLAYFPSGIMMKWFHDLLFANSVRQSDLQLDAAEADHYSWLESQSPLAPTGLYITPHLIGTCNPDFNPSARGVIFGLSAGTSRGQIYKAILEGLACELAQIGELLAKAAGDFRDLYVTGGGSRSQLGLQLRAALTGRRLHVMQCQEAVCLGAAILGGVGAGTYTSISEAVDQVIREAAIVEPNPKLVAAYAGQAKQYRLLYSSLAVVRDTCAHAPTGEERQ
ncbi:MAG: FGGY-family carbohydrate kinase [Candidatus Acidiferrales bacterium]